MTLQNKIQEIRDTAEDITKLTRNAKVLTTIILEDERLSDKIHTLTYFADYLLDNIHNLSETIVEDSFKIVV